MAAVLKFFKRFEKSRSYRATNFRRLIDRYLGNKINPDYEKISKKVEKEIHKITKFELKLTSKWWLLFIRLIDSKKGSSDINKCIDDLFNETLCLPFSQNSSVVLLELYALILEYGYWGKSLKLSQETQDNLDNLSYPYCYLRN